MGSRADDTVYEHRHHHRSEVRSTMGMLRRFALKLTSTGFWQGMGVLLLDQTTRETEAAEVFPGIGTYARPPARANAEGIVGYLGSDAENPVWLAVRDEQTRRTVMGTVKPAPDETVIYNSRAWIVIRKDGSIVVRFPDGSGGSVEVRLATSDELNALGLYVRKQFSLDGGPGHVHATPSGPTTTVTPIGPSTAGPYDGTGPG